MFRSTLPGLVIMLGVVCGGLARPVTAAQDKAAQDKAAAELPAEQQPASAKKESEAKESEAKESEKEGSATKDAEQPVLEAAPSSAGQAAAGHAAAGHAEAGHVAAGHGGAHHDPHDLSHQNAGAKIADPSEWKSDLAVSSLIVFLCLLALLSKFAWRPIMEGLQKRERSIAANIEEAKRSAEMAAVQLRQYEARLAAATEEARGIVEQARRDAEVAKDRILAEAQEVAKRERQRAVEDINAAKNVALQEMTQKSVDLAVSLAGKLIHRQLRPEDHSQLIREMVDQFPSRN